LSLSRELEVIINDWKESSIIATLPEEDDLEMNNWKLSMLFVFKEDIAVFKVKLPRMKIMPQGSY
jgi:hypothetical protein